MGHREVTLMWQIWIFLSHKKTITSFMRDTKSNHWKCCGDNFVYMLFNLISFVHICTGRLSSKIYKHQINTGNDAKHTNSANNENRTTQFGFHMWLFLATTAIRAITAQILITTDDSNPWKYVRGILLLRQRHRSKVFCIINSFLCLFV